MKKVACLVSLLVLLAACRPSDGGITPTPIIATPPPIITRPAGSLPTLVPLLPTVEPTPGGIILPTPTAAMTPLPSPTPMMSPTPLPANGPELTYTVQAGDNLENIAGRFGLPVAHLQSLNGIADPNRLFVGQPLRIGAAPPTIDPALLLAPPPLLLPESEIVYSPAYLGFDTLIEGARFGGYLARHVEVVEGDLLTGPEIVDRVARRYSVGPRLLLVILELQSGWVTQPEPLERDFPLGLRDPNRGGLFKQLSWAANRLNDAYYRALQGQEPAATFKDGSSLPQRPGRPAGAIAIENLLAQLQTPYEWQWSVGQGAFLSLYGRLFDDPFSRAVTPLLPHDLTQPPLAIPWADDETWFFTGGPHGGWGEGSARAGLDFAPPTKQGCAPAAEWVRASADGLIIRGEHGEVVQDLDGDGFVGTGWTILYMHIAADGRVPVGTHVKAGDPIGHPSCEGGWSQATHLHIARRYNGVWLPANQPPVFNLEGWEAVAWPRSYDGELVRGSQRLQACACRAGPKNSLPGQ